jgi:CheY-like chemotaxis protein
MSLLGARILIVEDEPLLRLGLEDMVSELGCVLAGSEGALPEALKLAQTEQFDIAILDINLGGRRVDPICDVLAQRGIPFIFTTGYDGDGVPKPGLAAAVLQKPYAFEAFRAAIETALISRIDVGAKR